MSKKQMEEYIKNLYRSDINNYDAKQYRSGGLNWPCRLKSQMENAHRKILGKKYHILNENGKEFYNLFTERYEKMGLQDNKINPYVVYNFECDEEIIEGRNDTIINDKHEEVKVDIAYSQDGYVSNKISQGVWTEKSYYEAIKSNAGNRMENKSFSEAVRYIEKRNLKIKDAPKSQRKILMRDSFLQLEDTKSFEVKETWKIVRKNNKIHSADFINNSLPKYTNPFEILEVEPLVSKTYDPYKSTELTATDVKRKDADIENALKGYKGEDIKVKNLKNCKKLNKQQFKFLRNYKGKGWDRFYKDFLKGEVTEPIVNVDITYCKKIKTTRSKKSFKEALKYNIEAMKYNLQYEEIYDFFKKRKPLPKWYMSRDMKKAMMCWHLTTLGYSYSNRCPDLRILQPKNVLSSIKYK